MAKTKRVDKNVLFEAIKEPLRLLVCALLPFGIAYLKDLPYEWATIATIVLKTADKFLHEYGKATGGDKLVKGLVRF